MVVVKFKTLATVQLIINNFAIKSVGLIKTVAP